LYICIIKIYIYLLKDPISYVVRYVGQTNNLNQRLNRHLNNAKSNRDKRHISNWIRSISLNPIMEVIEECEPYTKNEREQYWIDYYRKLGYDLCNASNGGPGAGVGNTNCKGRVMSEETKKKISASNKGRKSTHGKGGVEGKSIGQYTKDGELIATFPSILNAFKVTGICRRTIQYSLKNNKQRQRHPFIWKYL